MQEKPSIWIIVGQESTELAKGAGDVVFGYFSHAYYISFSLFSLVLGDVD